LTTPPLPKAGAVVAVEPGKLQAICTNASIAAARISLNKTFSLNI
jgi:hypothetical protein